MTTSNVSTGMRSSVHAVIEHHWFSRLILFIASIVNPMQTFTEEEHALERQQDKLAEQAEQKQLHVELKAIREELQQLRAELAAKDPAASDQDR